MVLQKLNSTFLGSRKNDNIPNYEAKIESAHIEVDRVAHDEQSGATLSRGENSNSNVGDSTEPSGSLLQSTNLANSTEKSGTKIHATASEATGCDQKGGISSFEMLTRRKSSYITVTMTASSPSANKSIHQHHLSSSQDFDSKSKREKLRLQWEETCLKWGFVVVRQITYIQNTFSDISQHGSDFSVVKGGESGSDNLIIDGREVSKNKDELIISKVILASYADSVGLREGDVIDAVYGMKSPNLGLLFGIMRDSSTFQLTIRRMETKFERDHRMGKVNNSDVRSSMNSMKITASGEQSLETTVPVSLENDGDTNNSTSAKKKLNGSQNFTRNRMSDDDRARAAEECMRDLDPDIFQFSDDDFDNNIDDDSNRIEATGDDSNLSGVAVDDDDPDLFGGEVDNESNRQKPPDKAAKENVAHVSESLPGGDSQTSETVNPNDTATNSNPARLTRHDDDEEYVDKEITSEDANDATARYCNKNERKSIEVQEKEFVRINGSIINGSNKTNNINPPHSEHSKISTTPDSPDPSNKDVEADELGDACSSFNDIIPLESKTKSRHRGTTGSHSSNQLDLDRGKQVAMLQLHIEKKDEDMLTNMIMDSIKSTDNPKTKKKSKKRKMSESSMSSLSKQDKKSKSKLKKKEKKSSIGLVVGEAAARAPSTRDDGISKSDDGTKLHKNGLSCRSTSDGRPPRDITIDETKTKRKFDRNTGGEEVNLVEGIHKGVPHRDIATANADVISSLRKQRANSVSSIELSLNNTDSTRKRPHRASPYTIPRASPLTVSRHNSKVTVSSTSSMAGLGAVKSTKLKRLWPDSSLFSKRILKWLPPQVVVEDYKIRFKGPPKSNVERKKLPVIPSTFRDTSEIIKFMSPHILEEGVHAAEQEFLANSDRNGLWTREVFSMHLRHCTPVDPRPTTGSSPSVRTYEFAFRLDTNGGAQPPLNLGEMFVVHSPLWKNRSYMGIIGSNDINSTFLADQKVGDEDSNDLFKLWICSCGEYIEDAGWVPEKDMPLKNPDGSFPPQTMYALNIGTCTDMMRQYEGLKSLASIKSTLKKALFDLEKVNDDDKIAGEMIDTVPSGNIPKPPSVCASVWDKLKRSTNPFQLSAIEKIMSGKMKDNIALMQGPPGTGKTSTTVAIVSALLNGSAPSPGTKSSGTRVQIGRALQNSNSGNVKHDSIVGRRILVCAPSNQAVDELAWKIHNNAIGGSGKVGGFNMVRFGMLPGDERHDGRGRGRSSQRSSSLHGNQRDSFLSAINLDKMVRDVASGKEIHDFRHSDHNKQARNNDTSRKSKYINYSAERQKILSHCHVVCTTLSGAGSKAFIESVSRDEFQHSEFDAVIIDEACQGSEMSCLIPFKYNPNVVVLVGDPNQLPVMTFSQDASRCNADRSLFDRLHLIGQPINMLRIQYRMHPAIVHFPSKTFYDDNLITCDQIFNRPPAIWHDHIAFPPYLLWNLQGGVMNRGDNGGISNNAEANFVLRLLKKFAERYANVRNVSIGVISFYSEQVARIKDRVKDQHLLRWMKSNKISLQVSTVDGFQGSEKDIIILSCVRSRWIGRDTRGNIGFLKDFRRVNVALTRAKYSLWVIANCNTLSRDALWNDLINDAHYRNLVAESNDLNRFTGGDQQRKKAPKNKKKRPGHKKKNNPSSFENEGKGSNMKLEK